jgi:hypothetical protein
MPPVMVGYKGSDPASKATADQLADILASGTRASYPLDGFKAELLTGGSGSSRGGDMYDNAIEWCSRTYDQIILGHSQVSGVQVGAGSRSSSGDAIALFKDVTNSRAKELDNDLYRECWHPYVVREFGQQWADENCPVTESSILERDDPVELSTVALNLMNAGAAGSIGVEDLVERCGVDLAEDGELTLAGNVKGDIPSPVEIAAQSEANPQASATQPGTSGQGTAAPSGVLPGQKPGKPTGKATSDSGDSGSETKSAGANFGTRRFATLTDFQPGARAAVRKRKGKRQMAEAYTRRQRFAVAALVGGKPRVIVTSFGHDLGIPEDSDMNIDVRHMSHARPFDAARTGLDPDVKAAIEAHPMTHAVYGGVKSQATQAIRAATLTGATDLRLGIGCEHGKHRGPYVAERLGQELREEGHDVTVQHRDATGSSGTRGIGIEADGLEASRFAVVHIPKKPAAFRVAQAHMAARVHQRLRSQFSLALKELDEAREKAKAG